MDKLAGHHSTACRAPDPETRETLARAFATINNKAEGSAPLSVIELARAILRHADG